MAGRRLELVAFSTSTLNSTFIRSYHIAHPADHIAHPANHSQYLAPLRNIGTHPAPTEQDARVERGKLSALR
jgi:hypothetical protein